MISPARVTDELTPEAIEALYHILPKAKASNLTVPRMLRFLEKACPRQVIRVTRDPSFGHEWFVEVSLFRVLRRGNQATLEEALWQVTRTVALVLAGNEVMAPRQRHTFGDRLRIAMRKAQMTPLALSQHSGVSLSVVYHYMGLRSARRVRKLAPLATALGVTVGYLMGEHAAEVPAVDVAQGIVHRRRGPRKKRGLTRRSGKMVDSGSWV